MSKEQRMANWKVKTPEEWADKVIDGMKVTECVVITGDGQLRVTPEGHRIIAEAIREAVEAVKA